ncbi:unnamed protein product [Pedinophyceae sp. YPF-701]|nr:unnamed protein product [Pedinophyceae sp. YPF-701]
MTSDRTLLLEPASKVAKAFNKEPFEIPASGFVLGRAPPKDNIKLPAGWLQVSSKHCSIQWKDIGGQQGWYVKDTSTNGTFRNDKQVERGVDVLIRPGDTLTLARQNPKEERDTEVRYIVSTLERSVPRSPENGSPLTRDLSAAAFHAPTPRACPPEKPDAAPSPAAAEPDDVGILRAAAVYAERNKELTAKIAAKDREIAERDARLQEEARRAREARVDLEAKIRALEDAARAADEHRRRQDLQLRGDVSRLAGEAEGLRAAVRELEARAQAAEKRASDAERAARDAASAREEAVKSAVEAERARHAAEREAADLRAACQQERAAAEQSAAEAAAAREAARALAAKEEGARERARELEVECEALQRVKESLQEEIRSALDSYQVKQAAFREAAKAMKQDYVRSTAVVAETHARFLEGLNGMIDATHESQQQMEARGVWREHARSPGLVGAAGGGTELEASPGQGEGAGVVATQVAAGEVTPAREAVDAVLAAAVAAAAATDGAGSSDKRRAGEEAGAGSTEHAAKRQRGSTSSDGEQRTSLAAALEAAAHAHDDAPAAKQAPPQRLDTAPSPAANNGSEGDDSGSEGIDIVEGPAAAAEEPRVGDGSDSEGDDSDDEGDGSDDGGDDSGEHARADEATPAKRKTRTFKVTGNSQEAYGCWVDQDGVKIDRRNLSDYSPVLGPAAAPAAAEEPRVGAVAAAGPEAEAAAVAAHGTPEGMVRDALAGSQAGSEALGQSPGPLAASPAGVCRG